MIHTNALMRLSVAIVALVIGAGIAGCGDVDPAHVEPRAGRTRLRNAPPQRPRPALPGDSETVRLTMAEPIRKYGVRSGIVEYRNERLGRRQTLYFDDGGADEAVYLESAGDSVDVPFDVSIYTGTWRFDYNSAQSRGIAKLQPNARGAMLGFLPDLHGVSLAALEPRTIAGRRATGVSFGSPPTRAWFWKGIPLRIERPVRGGADTLVIEAVSIRVDEKIPAERFEVPRSVRIARLK